MKTLYIAIISASVISLGMLLFFIAIYSYNSSNQNISGHIGGLSSMEPLLVNIVTEPERVIAGNSFQIYATVKNVGPWPITFHDGCTSPLTVSFDKNVQIQNEIGCNAISSEVINPGEQVRVHGPRTGLVYNATAVGTTNATITFSYQDKGNTYNITTYKQIAIESTPPLPSNLPEQLGLAQSDSINPLGVTVLVLYSPPDACLGLHCPPYTFYLKMNANYSAYLIGYDICGDDLCVKNNTLSVLLPIKNTLVANYTFIGLSDNKKWNYGDPVDIRLELASSENGKDAYFLDIKNSTIVP